MKRKLAILLCVALMGTVVYNEGLISFASNDEVQEQTSETTEASAEASEEGTYATVVAEPIVSEDTEQAESTEASMESTESAEATETTEGSIESTETTETTEGSMESTEATETTEGSMESTEATDAAETETADAETAETETAETETTETDETTEGKNLLETLVDLLTGAKETTLTQTVGEVTITLTADKGVFPAGATLSAEALSSEEETKAAEAVDAALGEETTVVKTMSYDITILDADGKEIQPADGTVQVTFAAAEAIAEASEEGKELKVFHLADDASTATEVQVTGIDEEAETVSIEAESFSPYTIAITTSDKTSGFAITNVAIVKSFDNNTKTSTYFEDDDRLKDSDTLALYLQYKITSTVSSTSSDKDYSFTVDLTNVPIKSYTDASIQAADGKPVATAKIEESAGADGKKTGTVTVTFKKDYIGQYLKEGEEGGFYFGGSFDASKVGNGGPFTIEWQVNGQKVGASQTLHAEVAQPSDNISVSKSADDTTADLVAKNLIKWTVDITPTSSYSGKLSGYFKSITFSDKIEEGSCGNTYIAGTEEDMGSYAPTVTVTKSGASATTLSGVSVKNTDGTLSLVMNDTDGVTGTALGEDFKSGDKITVTYYTQYDATMIGEGKTINNKATAVLTPYKLVEDPNGGTKVSTTETNDPKNGEGSKSVYLKNGDVSKTSQGFSDGRIKWEIKATNARNNTRPVLVDTVPKGLTVYESSIKLGDTAITKAATALNAEVTSAQYTINKDTTTGVTTLSIYLPQGTEEKTVTYETTLDEGAVADANSTTRFENKVVFQYWNAGKNTPGWDTIKTGSASQNVNTLYGEKNGSYDRSTHEVTWTVTLTNLATQIKSDSTAPITIEDTFGHNATGDVAQQLVKAEGKEDYAEAVSLKVGETEYKLTPTALTEDTDFSKGFSLTIDSTTNSGAYNALKSFTGENGATVTLTYKTVLTNKEDYASQGDNESSIWKDVYNTTVVGTKDIPREKITLEGKVSAESKLLEKKCDSYDYPSHKAKYTLTVNHNRMYLGDNATITDTLDQAGWTFNTNDVVVKTIPLTKGNDDWTSMTTLTSGKDYEVTSTAPTDGANATMTITLKSDTAKNSKLQITYSISLPDASTALLNKNKKITVKNTATLKATNIAKDISTSKSFAIEKGVISKSYAKGATAFDAIWTINVNENFAKVTNSDNSGIVIVDTLPAGILFPGVDAENVVTVKQYKDLYTPNKTLTKDTDYTLSYDEKTREVSIAFKDGNGGDLKELTTKYVITINTVVTAKGNYSNSVKIAGTESGQRLDATKASGEIQISGGYHGTYASLFGTLQIVKQDANDATKTNIAGAKYGVYTKENGTDADKVGEITTQADASQNVLLLANGTYYLHELTQPTGYNLDSSWIKVEVKGGKNADGSAIVTKQIVTDVSTSTKQGTYKFSKVAAGLGDELAGATLKIAKDEKGTNVVASWTSTTTPKELELYDGTYWMIEETAPYGYKVAEKIQFKASADGESGTITVSNSQGSASGNTLTMTDAVDNTKTGSVTISKKAAGGVEELKGALLRVVEGDGAGSAPQKEVASWTSDGNTKPISNIQYLTSYWLIEDQAPLGYQIASQIGFRLVPGETADKDYVQIYKDGKWETQTGTTVTMVDKHVSDSATYSFSKGSMGQGKELAGAKLSIYPDVNGNRSTTALDTWTSESDQSHEVKLADGTYYLVEETAPYGYEVAESIQFRVALDEGQNPKITIASGDDHAVVTGNTLMMKDAYDITKTGTVKISKQAAGGGEELAGAVLTLYTWENGVEDAVELERWTSDGTVKEITGIKYQCWYALAEDQAPVGYDNTEWILFRLIYGENGDYVETGDMDYETNEVNGWKTHTDNVVVMTDEHLTDLNTYYFSKESLSGQELDGAKLAICADNEGVLGETLASWISKSGESKSFVLADGTYWMKETTAPYGYEVAESIRFTVNVVDDRPVISLENNTGAEVIPYYAEDGTEYRNTLVMKDAYDSDASATVKISKQAVGGGAELPGAKLTVSIQDSNGDWKEVESWTSGEAPHELSGLYFQEMYMLTENQAPLGYDVAESMIFWVEYDAETGKQVVYAGKLSDTSVSAVTNDTIVMLDAKQPTTTTTTNDKPTTPTITTTEAIKEINSLIDVPDSADRQAKVAELRTKVQKLLSENPKAFDNESAEMRDIVENLVENGVLGRRRLAKTGGFLGTAAAYGAGAALLLGGAYLTFGRKKRREED